MTLFRQIALLISLIFLLLLGSILWSNVRQYSHYTQGQMQAVANDMATNIGVTIANGVDVNDVAEIDTLFNAVFDSGYYLAIELRSTDGKIISSRTQPLVIYGVPEWLTKLVPLKAATGTTQVMKGWSPLGTLKITIHPGYAYAGLYSAIKHMALWFVVLSLGGLLALWYLLKLIMRPLVDVQHQAEAIEENHFILQEDLPRTKELRHVASAMNRMVGKVQKIVNDQTHTLKQYHELLYQDPSTGLGNRRYFVMRLQQLVQDEEKYGGSIILLYLHGLNELLQDSGFEHADRILHRLAQEIEALYESQGSGFGARMNNTDFVICLPEIQENAEEKCKALFRSFSNSIKEEGYDDRLWLCAGITTLTDKAPVGEILASADYSLTQAKSAGAYAIVRAGKENHDLPQGKMQWRDWLKQSLDSEKFFLVGQPVHNSDDSLLHHELFVRLRDETGNILPAGHFMPVASSLGLEFTIDREVLRIALEHQSGDNAYPVAINLSRSVMSNADSLAEFDSFIDSYSRTTSIPLFVEVTHFTLVRHAEVARHVAEKLREYGFFFGVDHFDLGSNLEVLQVVRPAYVKIDANQLIAMINESALSGLQPLRTLAQSMDIRLIAVGVDNEEMYQVLRNIEELGLQGNYLSEPRELQ